MVKNIHDKLNQSDKTQNKQSNQNNKEKNSGSTAPTNDDRPHWCRDCRAAGKKMRNGPCPGHGIESKGGGDESKQDSAGGELITSGSVAAVLSEQINKLDAAEPIDAEEAEKLNEILDAQPDLVLLADLIHGSLKLISIKNEADIGKLTIEWHPEFLSPKVLSDEVKRELIRFVNAIEKELEKFVNQNGIQVGGFTKDIKMDNNTGMPKSLVITFANRNHYENFYKQLDKNVLSKINYSEMKDKKHDDAKGENKFHPTPKALSTKLERE